MRPLRIAVASGKGGTGKTTLATNLAVVLAEGGESVAYVDCDVEEPNGEIFLRPEIHHRYDVEVPVPEVDLSNCTFCGECGAVCQYSAIVVLPQKVITFPKLCHGCGGCTLACPERVIREKARAVGRVEVGVAGSLAFLHGILEVGEAMAPPVIRALLDHAPKDHTLILDAPPGTSCPVIESIKTADGVILVTEPTPFGLNDLALAVDMVQTMGLPFGVVVNRAGVGDRAVFDYCEKEKIPVLLEVPNDIAVARAYSRGELMVRAIPAWKSLFEDLVGKVWKLAESVPRKRFPKSFRAEQVIAEQSPNLTPVGLHPRNNVSECVVISGKGGTGKTSITASFAHLASSLVVADCDVDAADLHLLLHPDVQQEHPFSGGSSARVNPEACTSCGLCLEHCRFDAMIDTTEKGAGILVDPVACEGCGVCQYVCPEDAVDMVRCINGFWFVSETSQGPMVHARLGVAQENSGKLVSLVRKEGKKVAEGSQRSLLLCDGSPGIGCPVIASITGAKFVLVVTEPTLSGLHDLERVLALTKQLQVRCGVCINKADINLQLSEEMERKALAHGIELMGRVRYDESVTHAQVRREAVVEREDSLAGQDIRELWKRVSDGMGLSIRPAAEETKGCQSE